MIGEIRDVWNFDGNFGVDWKVVAIVGAFIVMFIVYGWFMVNHGHVFDMSSSPVPFGSGHPANGDVSIFGVDNFHFRNE